MSYHFCFLGLAQIKALLKKIGPYGKSLVDDAKSPDPYPSDTEIDGKGLNAEVKSRPSPNDYQETTSTTSIIGKSLIDDAKPHPSPFYYGKSLIDDANSHPYYRDKSLIEQVNPQPSPYYQEIKTTTTSTTSTSISTSTPISGSMILG